MDGRAIAVEVELRDPGFRAQRQLTDPATPTEKSRLGRGRTIGIVLSVVALALVVRLFRLDSRSLWLDEILTSQPAHLVTPGDVIAWTQAAIDQMPVFYLGTWLLGHWGDNPLLLRAPAVVEGTLIVPAVYLVARRLFGVPVALIGALITALMPFMVWYSQEARNYSLFMLLTTLQAYCAYAAIKDGRALHWLGLVLFTILNLYTHYLALFATTAFAVYIAAFVARDFFTTAPKGGRIGVAIILMLGIAAIGVAGRRGITAAYGDAAALLASPTLHSTPGLAALIILLLLFVTAAVYMDRRSRTFKLTLAGNLAAALIVSALALRYGHLTPPGGHPPLRFAVVPAILAILTVITGALVLLDLVRSSRQAERRLRMALIAGAVIALAYAPWIPALQGFLTRPNQTIGKIHVEHAPSIGDLAALLSKLGLTGLLLAALVAGVAVMVLWFFRGRAMEAGLTLAWLLVPLAMFVGLAGTAIVDIDYRYLSFIMPGAIITIAVGIVESGRRLESGLRRIGGQSSWLRWPSVAAVTLILLVAVVAQTAVGLAQSYAIPKEDYRTVAQRIAAAGDANAVVLSEGAYSDWTVICLDYYFRQLGSSALVSDGLQVNSDVFDRLQRNGPVWGVVIFPSSDQITLMRDSTAVKIDYIDATRKVWVVRAADTGAAAIDQAQDLLRWELPLEPQLSASMGLLDLHLEKASLGSSVLPLPPAQGWTFGPGTSWSGGAATLDAVRSTDEVAVTIAGSIAAGKDYAIRFEHRGQQRTGSQHVYVLAYDAAGNLLATYPDGGGYSCAPGDQWQQSDFAFAAPAGSSTVEVLLRVHGAGEGEFRNVALGELVGTSS